MSIEKLEIRKKTETNRKLTKAYNKMEALIVALNQKKIPTEVLIYINEHIMRINSFGGSEKELTKNIRKSYSQILKFIEEKLEYVTKHHYRTLWMVYGMLAGAVFSSVFSSFEFVGIGFSAGIGLPMGMLIGIIIGTHLDQKAEKDNRQLELVAE